MLPLEIKMDVKNLSQILAQLLQLIPSSLLKPEISLLKPEMSASTNTLSTTMLQPFNFRPSKSTNLKTC